MANVKATVLTPFIHKGEQYEKDDEISLPLHAAATYAKIDFVELNEAGEHRVELAAEKAAEESEKETKKKK